MELPQARRASSGITGIPAMSSCSNSFAISLFQRIGIALVSEIGEQRAAQPLEKRFLGALESTIMALKYS